MSGFVMRTEKKSTSTAGRSADHSVRRKDRTQIPAQLRARLDTLSHTHEMHSGGVTRSTGIGRDRHVSESSTGKIVAIIQRMRNNVVQRCGKKRGSSGTRIPYATSRPSYGKNQVEEVWENAKDPTTGKVCDPTGVEITWDTTKPRSGQWDMGHKPGEEYAKLHQLYMSGIIDKGEFLRRYRDAQNYRPELVGTNRSHQFEQH